MDWHREKIIGWLATGLVGLLIYFALAIFVYQTAFAQIPPEGEDASGIVTTFNYETKFTYTGNVVTFSWCHDDADVVFDLEVYEYSVVGNHIRVAIVTDFPARSFEWTPQRIGFYFVQVRAQNVPAVHGDDLVSDWRISYDQASADDHATCPVPPGGYRNFLVYADISPPSDGGIE